MGSTQSIDLPINSSALMDSRDGAAVKSTKKDGKGKDEPDAPSMSSVQKPYNNYNVFFILERVRLIEARKKDKGAAVRDDKKSNHRSHQSISSNGGSIIAGSTGYEDLELPPLPSRYKHLRSALPSNWFVPGKSKNTKRKHKATHRREFL